ncbi:MAG: PD-(D/E)XK nuclease family protein [Archangiaceae bacterium]|nr:PD-(D/E)XK nuclease family protein [Archangiaceae bacterium]
MAPRTLRVFPDAARVEHALLEASLARDFVDATGFWSFAQLVEACAPPGLKPLSRLQARLVVASLVRDGGPGPFGAWSKDPAFARAAVELFAQLEGQLATPDQLDRAAEAAGSPRAAWVARLWHRFKRRKAELEVFDSADLLAAATAHLQQGVPEALSAFVRLELGAMVDFSRARLAFVRALDAAFPQVELRLPRVDDPSIDALVNEVHAELERGHETSKLELYGEPVEPLAPKRLEAFDAVTPREEARELARRVRVCLDEGAAPEEVAVVFRELGPDTEMVLEALAERGVPARARLSVPLAFTPAGHLALGLPTLVEEGFGAEAVARYLTSRYLPRLWEPGSEPGVFFAQAGLRDDRLGAQKEQGAYAVRLAALATRFQEGWPKGPAEEVRAVARQVERLIAAVRPLRAEDTLEGHLRGWAAALEQLGLLEGLRTEPVVGREGPAAEQALARDQAAADALTALQRLLFEASRGFGGAKLTRREFSRWLRDAAADLNLLSRGPRAGAVAVLEARELPGRTFRHVFIGGLVDGRFPGRGAGGGLLAEDEKGALNRAARAPLFRLNVGESDGRLPLRLAEDRLLFYLALAAGLESVTLSHARGEALGRAFSPSPFLSELARSVEGFAVKRLPRATVPAADAVSNDAELRLRAMLDGARPDAPWAQEALALAEMEHERLRFFSEESHRVGEYSGAVEPALLQGDFAFDRERPLTAAKLGAWGNCSFAGFLGDVLGLESPEAQSEDLDQRSKGTLMHRVLELLLPVLRGPLPEDLEQVVELAVEEAAGVHQRRAPTGHPLLWQLGRQRAAREIAALIRSGRVRPFDGLLPEKAEWKFAVELEGTGVVLGGKVDRIDVSEGRAGVVDYKTAKIIGNADKVNNLLVSEWQLPIYAYAVRQAGLAKSVDAMWLSTREGEKALSTIAGEAGVTLDELLATDELTRARLERDGKPNLGSAVQRLVGSMRAGELAARPHDCEYCRFRPVCRISSRKLHEEGR